VKRDQMREVIAVAEETMPRLGFRFWIEKLLHADLKSRVTSRVIEWAWALVRTTGPKVKVQ
jgi:hypothetical protein